MIVFWRCCGDLEQAWTMAISEQQARDHFLEIDLEIERELGPWPSMGGGFVEEADVERVPIELVGWAHG